MKIPIWNGIPNTKEFRMLLVSMRNIIILLNQCVVNLKHFVCLKKSLEKYWLELDRLMVGMWLFIDWAFLESSFICCLMFTSCFMGLPLFG